MKVQVEEISSIKKKLNFEIPEEAYQKSLGQAYQKLQRKVQIKGFRKGKVPRSVLEQYYGAKTQMETIQELIDQSYRQAVQEHQIHAVDLPKIDQLKMDAGQPITFIAEVEVQPEVKAQHYEGIKLQKTKIQVTAEQIESELQGLQKKQAQGIPTDEKTKAKKGHQVQINYQGFLNGEPFEGGQAENVSIVLGAGQFLPDFEKGVMGSHKGEAKEFKVKFPEDYPAENLKGQTANFKAEILEIKQEQLPEIDDDFAKDLGNYQDLESLKKEVQEHLESQQEKEQRNSLFKQILDHLIAKNPFEVPEVMVERELQHLWNQFKQRLEQQNLNPEALGTNEADYREKNKQAALERIKAYILFDSVAAQNQIKIEETDLNERLEKLAQGFKQPVESIRRIYEQQGMIPQLRSEILEQKTLDFILSKAEIKIGKTSKNPK